AVRLAQLGLRVRDRRSRSAAHGSVSNGLRGGEAGLSRGQRGSLVARAFLGDELGDLAVDLRQQLLLMGVGGLDVCLGLLDLILVVRRLLLGLFGLCLLVTKRILGTTQLVQVLGVVFRGQRGI